MSRALASLLLVFFTFQCWAESSVPDVSPRDTPSCTMRMSLTGSIGSGSLDYLERGLQRARTEGCVSVLILINTPGGSLSTTRTMVERILNSPLPVLCLVAPEGAHAGSAGAYILEACHVNGALPATNLGAGTPITPSGDIEKDLRAKVIADTVSWITGLARLRGRNSEFAEKLVTEARAIDADEAARIHAIDTVSTDPARFLDFAEGRTVTMSGGQTTLVKTGALRDFEPDLRTRFLQFVADPQIAYLLFMASLALLYFEITHTGMVAPGVLGGIGLVLALIAFQFLEVRWGAAALITLGLGFMIGEAFMPTFGVLGIGGLVALAAGSLLLYDPGPEGLTVLSPYVVTATVIVAGGFMLGLAVFAYRTRRRGGSINDSRLIGEVGEVATLEAPSLRRGMVIVGGEYWRFRCERDVRQGDQVRVMRQENLELIVEPHVSRTAGS